MPTVIVIGGGIAGITSAIRCSSYGLDVLLIDKAPNLGGNSMMATSGVSAVNIFDNDAPYQFLEDIARNAGIKSDSFKYPLIRTLAFKSIDAMKFLDQCGVRFDKVYHTGGHGRARTFTSTEHAPIGAYIINTLKESLGDIRIMLSTKLLSIDRINNTITVSSYKDPIPFKYLILATGGYSNNKTYIQSKLPTTNCSTGDGIDIGTSIGLELVDMDKIQIHPTGFIGPDQSSTPCNKRVLCPENFRAIGGILVNQDGERFVDELSSRKEVTNAILEQSEAFIVFKPKLVKNNYKLFKWYIDSQYIRPIDHLYVGQVWPCIHFTIGGLRITDTGNVVSKHQPVKNIYACGELASVFYKDRLCGCGLLSGIVFGLVCAENILFSYRNNVDN